MKLEKKTDPENCNKYLNRRNALKAFGLAAISGTTVSAFSKDKEKRYGSINQNSYSSVIEMQQDNSLKAGTFVRTVGYYRLGDGGDSEYLIKEGKAGEETGAVSLNDNLYASLVNVSVVNYKIFGAVGDGKNDDGVQIKLAHQYANEKNIPVVNLAGEYWIKATNGIEIKTNVQWGHSIFHIDEKFNSSKNNRFIVSGVNKPVVLEFDQATRNSILTQLKPGVTRIPEFAPYKNSLIVITDSHDRIGSRSGEAYRGRATRSREEFFFIEEHGRILGDIAWGFKDFTKIVSYPVDSNFLLLEGGTFYLSGEGAGIKSDSYFQMGFSVNRSRTVIRNQWVGLEKEQADISLSPRGGFYSFNYVYDVLLENVRLIPWEKNRPGEDKDIPHGTYGIGGSYVLNATFRNVTAEGSPVHWGVFGTNLFKNFRVEQCVLNRIDVHFYCWNLYIKDSKVGTNGITITGGGDLFVENTICRNNNFITFRRDYGAKWDGDIRIRNCRHAPAAQGETAILSFTADDFDYKYPIGYGRTIKVEDMVIDFHSIPYSKSTGWLMKVSPFSQTTGGHRVFFPYHLEFRNIMTEGREQGIRILQIPDPQNFKLAKSGSYDHVQLKSNCKMIFEDIQLEDLSQESVSGGGTHFQINSKSQNRYQDGYALYPEVRMTRCNDLVANFGGNIVEVYVEQSKIAGLTGSDSKELPGALTFSNCKFEALINKNGPSFLLDSELGTSFTNCVVYAPVEANISRPELIDRVGFLTINKAVLYNHINTRLGNDIIKYLKINSIKLTDHFIGMLKSHSDLEP
ncbi:MAG TPA: hypothetical protein VGD22_03875 [Sphingobacteriaceae bacterium]